MQSSQPGAHPLSSGAVSATVLVAEDEAVLRDLARRALTYGGFTVLDAENGAAALAVAQGHPGPIDLLVTDVVMPGMNGPALAAKVRQLRPGIRVLFVSGYLGDDLTEHAEGWGEGERLLTKPFTPFDLLREVRALLAGPNAAS